MSCVDEEKKTEYRYCASCMRERPADGFKLLPASNGQRRWKCGLCVAKKSATFYGRNK